MTKPADKWMEKAREIVASQLPNYPEYASEVCAGKRDDDIDEISAIAPEEETSDRSNTL